MSELLPCPFCGSTKLQLSKFSVDCMECWGSMLGHEKKETITKWNTRTKDEPLPKENFNKFADEL